MKFSRILFLIAGIYGIVALTPQYFTEKLIGRRFPPPITHPEYYYGFVGVVVVWHLLFLVISKDPARYRPLMLLGVLEKFVFGLPTVALYLQGRVSKPILIGAVIDLVFGVLFILAYRASKDAAVAYQPVAGMG